MSNLDTQTKQFSIVLNVPHGRYFQIELLTDFMNRNCFMYALIKHDKDTDKDGNLKTLHYHIIMKTNNRYRLSTMLYRIADCLMYFKAEELNCISIEKCDSIPLSIQYLTHKNNADKYQYDYKDIITNLSDKDLEDYYNSKADTEINAKYLTQLVMDGYSDFEILHIIGIGRYHLYKGAIADIRYALSRTPDKVNNFLKSVQ